MCEEKLKEHVFKKTVIELTFFMAANVIGGIESFRYLTMNKIIDYEKVFGLTLFWQMVLLKPEGIE